MSSSRGTGTKSGSASFALRSMNARRNASATKCMYSGVPKAGSGPNVSRMLNVSVIVIPPDDAGGMVMSVWPRYVLTTGSRHLGP